MAKVSGMLFQLVLMSGRTVRMERLLFAMGWEAHLVFMFSLSLCAEKEECVPATWNPPALFC